jgi:histone H3/H4
MSRGNTPGYDFEAKEVQLLPIANVGHIMKAALPRNAKISKEAKELMQECVTEFIPSSPVKQTTCPGRLG